MYSSYLDEGSRYDFVVNDSSAGEGIDLTTGMYVVSVAGEGIDLTTGMYVVSVKFDSSVSKQSTVHKSHCGLAPRKNAATPNPVGCPLHHL